MTFHLKPEVIEEAMLCEFEVKNEEGGVVSKLHVGERYTLKCNIYEEITGGCYNPLRKPFTGVAVTFTKKETGEVIGTDTSTEYGYAGAYWTPDADDVGEHTLKAECSDDYQEYGIEVISVECDKGAIVTVKDVPTEGLRVQTAQDIPLYGCNWSYDSREEMVSQDDPVAVFGNLYTDIISDKACFRVVTMDYDLIAKTGYVLSITKGFVVPTVGCKPVAMLGYYGKPYRCRLTAEPSNPEPGVGFWLTAHLTVSPDGEAADPDLPITFYRVVGEIREQIGDVGLTDSTGVAKKAWSESVAGTYTYEAEYEPTQNITFVEPVTVNVTKDACPINISALEECPILKALQGTIVFTHLDTLRWYRDTKMSPTLVKSYYKLIPITGRIARHSRLARTIVRALSTFSIRSIERRWGGEIPYLQTLKAANE